MSAPHQAQLERELGASIRTFRSVEEALRWFDVTPRGPAGLRGLPLEQGPGPGCAENRSRRDATSFAISGCMRGLHHAGLLVEWCCSWRTPESMARDEGFPSVYALRSTMRWTERLLAQRMVARGLLR